VIQPSAERAGPSPVAAPPILAVEALSAAYGRQQVLSGVTFSVPEGSAIAIVGPNGAGKSTITSALAGRLSSEGGRLLSGSIHIREEDVTRRPTARRLELGMAVVPERRELWPNMTVRENLRLGGWWLPKHVVEERVGELENAFERLGERAQQRAGSLSGGEQQLLAVARALVSRPSLLVLDEPSLGLAPIWIESIYDVVKDEKSKGASILVLEQSASWASVVADMAHVLVGGRFVLSGSADEVLNRPDLGELYLRGVPSEQM
jgi:branched-chain amino acid transport system ATP-binding protein